MKVEIDIPHEHLVNMLRSASGYCGYWCKSDLDLTRALEKNVRIRVTKDCREVVGDDSPYILDKEALSQGIAICALRSPKVFAALLENNCDGPTADVIVQYALFGKTRFG